MLKSLQQHSVKLRRGEGEKEKKPRKGEKQKEGGMLKGGEKEKEERRQNKKKMEEEEAPAFCLIYVQAPVKSMYPDNTVFTAQDCTQLPKEQGLSTAKKDKNCSKSQGTSENRLFFSERVERKTTLHVLASFALGDSKTSTPDVNGLLTFIMQGQMQCCGAQGQDLHVNEI
ncbi:hypothetical protein TREES_T100008864 [Tupaia chinensis]|uniref:Uncharacterized protein n=1 Tax=Tupaia chinensis TaxID=246437 RepID=L9L0Y4_TUPCH|nr:hypothetical protein TREES_T100008864 [Tupaia chinensis]